MDILLWGSIFFAGLLSFFSPCVLPLFPVYFGVLMSERGNRSIKIGKFEIAILPVIRTLLFVAGISTIFFALGFAASLLGQLLYNPYFHLVLGTIIVLLGLHQMEVFQLTTLQKQKTVQFETKKEHSLWSSYLLGLSFSFGWTPCVGPVLSSVLTLVATQQASVFYGMFLLGIYILGLSIASTAAMKAFNLAKKQLFLLKKIGGAIIIAMGVWIIIQQLQVLFLQG